MRISTQSSFDSGVSTLQRRQADLARSQEQLTSGKRVDRPSDDPAAAARAERALAGIGRVETGRRAVEASRVAMEQTEGALGDAFSLLQQVRESMVAAGNPAYADGERAGLAEKVRALRAQLFEVANRSDGAGVYLFGGQGATQPPFVDAPGGVQYASTTGEQRTAAGMPLTLDGRATWLAAPTGNGVFETRPGAGVTQAWIGPGQVADPSAITGDDYTLQFSVAAGATTYAVLRNGAPTAVTAAPYVSGQAIAVDGMSVVIQGAPANGNSFDLLASSGTLSIFDSLDAAAVALDTPSQTGAQRAQANSLALRDIDSFSGTLQTQRTAAGEALNRVDNEVVRLEAQGLRNQSERSSAVDLDMVQAVAEFQSRQTGYDAALKSYAMVQRLSLFDYLGR
jgi:flagellar hook-associated protein 3 FlgL